MEKPTTNYYVSTIEKKNSGSDIVRKKGEQYTNQQPIGACSRERESRRRTCRHHGRWRRSRRRRPTTRRRHRRMSDSSWDSSQQRVVKIRPSVEETQEEGGLGEEEGKKAWIFQPLAWQTRRGCGWSSESGLPLVGDGDRSPMLRM